MIATGQLERRATNVGTSALGDQSGATVAQNRNERHLVELVRAEQAWLALGVIIVGYEILAADGQLLSEAVDRALEKHPVLVRAAVLLLAGHLINALPNKVDPIHLLAVALRRRR